MQLFVRSVRYIRRAIATLGKVDSRMNFSKVNFLQKLELGQQLLTYYIERHCHTERRGTWPAEWGPN